MYRDPGEAVVLDRLHSESHRFSSLGPAMAINKSWKICYNLAAPGDWIAILTRACNGLMVPHTPIPYFPRFAGVQKFDTNAIPRRSRRLSVLSTFTNSQTSKKWASRLDRSGGLIWITTAFSTFRPPASPYLSVIQLDRTCSLPINRSVETVIKRAENNLRRITDEAPPDRT